MFIKTGAGSVFKFSVDGKNLLVFISYFLFDNKIQEYENFKRKNKHILSVVSTTTLKANNNCLGYSCSSNCNFFLILTFRLWSWCWSCWVGIRCRIRVWIGIRVRIR